MSVGPRFSVVIPAYNYGRFVARAVQSALAAQGPSREVIVVDDGSTDDTPHILRPYADRIISVRQRNQGVSAARNYGIELARGQFVVCLDADDTLLPASLEVFDGLLQRHPDAGIVFGGYRTVLPDGSRVPGQTPPRLTTPLENFRQYLLRKFTIGNGRAAIRRELLAQIRFPVGITHGEDLVVFGQVLANSPAAAVNVPVSECYDHGTRARRNFERLIENGDKTVDALFNTQRLPAAAMALRPLFAARWQLELARAAFKLGRTSQARGFFHAAWSAHWPALMDPRQLSRYVRTYFPAVTPVV